VLCFGGTKLGLPVGEAVVFFNKELAYEFDYRCKQAGQLASKMRFLAAPWIGLLRDNAAALYKHARHANACAEKLEAAIKGIPGARLLHSREANGVFVDLPVPAIAALRERGWRFYNFIGDGGVRFMCSWDTQPDDIEALVSDLRKVL
jgi:threonine aldolase